MDQFRTSGGGEAKEADSSSRAPFSPPSSSAFSRPILPSSSTLLLPPKPLGGAPNGTSGSGSGPAPDPPADAAGRYRECLRNHAASIGGHVVDGCGEFMPAGPAEPMKCAACGCHRSFHRREPEHIGGSLVRVPLLLPPPPPPPPPHHGPRTIGFGCSGNTTESSSEERNAHHSGGPLDDAGGRGRKKRFRTKFSSEQKEKMAAFAERVEWRVQRKDDAEMERFCREIGVSRQVLKVWMHNNKHLLVKKQQQQLQQYQHQAAVDQPPQQQHNQQQQEAAAALGEKNAVAR